MPRAELGLDEVIEFVESKWGAEQVAQLGADIASFLNHIGKYPRICPKSAVRHGLRKGYPNPHTYLVYRFIAKDDIIEVINFRSTRQMPIG